MNQKITPVAVLVEDDPVFRKSIEDAIHALPEEWKLHRFPQGSGALDFIQQPAQAIDLLLVDIGLPDISGLEIIRAAHQQFTDLPILVVSVIGKKRILVEAIRAGAKGYLLKGEGSASLSHAISEVLEGSYPVSPSLARHLFELAGAPPQSSNELPIDLSPRELELLKHLSLGNSYAECAQLMGVALSTIQTHIRNTYRKLEVSNQMQAVSKARDYGVI